MRFWKTDFQVLQPLEHLPRPLHLEQEQQVNSRYDCDGKCKCGIIKFTLRGRGVFEYGGIRRQLTPGVAFIRNGFDDIRYYYPPDGRDPWVFIWFAFQGGMAMTMVDQMIEKFGYLYNFDRHSGAFTDLLQYGAAGTRIVYLTAVAGSRLVLSLLHSLLDGKISDRLVRDRSRIPEVQEYIINHLEDPALSVASLARHFRLSRAHFSRVFHRDTGRYPDDFIRYQRLLSACSLLKDSNLNCKEIADRLGFSTPGNFSRAFRQTLGMAPLEFRRRGTMPSI